MNDGKSNSHWVEQRSHSQLCCAQCGQKYDLKYRLQKGKLIVFLRQRGPEDHSTTTNHTEETWKE